MAVEPCFSPPVFNAQTTLKGYTYLSTLLLDPLDHVLNTVHIHRLILVHIDRQSTAPHEKEDELVHRLLFCCIVSGCTLVRFDPVFDHCFEGDIGIEQSVWPLVTIHGIYDEYGEIVQML